VSQPENPENPENREPSREIQTREPDAVIRPRDEQPLARLTDNISHAIETLLPRTLFQGASAGGVDYVDLDPEAKKAVDEFIETLKPDIEQKAVALITAEIRDRVARTGNITRIKQLLKKGKKPTVKRKKGCIFIQFGTGEPDDEIEEFMVMST
jgi:hypothetical protein